MGSTRILLIQGHPDRLAPHLCHALAASYAAGAGNAGHVVRWTKVAEIDFQLLRSQEAWEKGSVPDSLLQAQADILWAEHIVLFFPLWLGDMPAILKGFLEQVARPNFAFEYVKGGTSFTKKKLTGRSARVVATMGMPSLVYRWYFRAHSIKSLERNILGFVGMAPVFETLIGSVGSLSNKEAEKWLNKLRLLGRDAK